MTSWCCGFERGRDDLRDGGRVPGGFLHGLDQRPGLGLDRVGVRAVAVTLSQAERLAQAGQGLGLTAPHLPGPQDGQDQVDPGLTGWGGAEHVQPVADLGVLDLAQPAVHVQQEAVELGVVRAVVQPEVVVELGGLDQRPDLGPDGGQLGRVQRRDLRVLVHQLFQAGDVAVALGAGHGRDQVTDQGGVGAPLGLRALAGVVDQERVDERDIADRGVRTAAGRHAGGLPGQPLQVAVLADVHHGVRGELIPQPAVGGEVVVARGQVRVVVDRDRVRAEPAGRLHHHDHVSGPQRGQHDLTLGVLAAVDEQFAGRRAPVSGDGGLELGVQSGEPGPVVGGADPHRVAGELLLGQPVLVLAAGGDDRVDEGIAVFCGYAGELVAADVVAGVRHRC